MSLAATYTARKRGRLGKSQTCAAPSDSARPPVALTPLLSCSRHRLLACPFSWHCGGGRLATGAATMESYQLHPKQRRALWLRLLLPLGRRTPRRRHGHGDYYSVTARCKRIAGHMVSAESVRRQCVHAAGFP